VAPVLERVGVFAALLDAYACHPAFAALPLSPLYFAY